jgi:hypothetical protein
MRTRDIYKMLAGGCVVYVALAACNAAEHGGKPSGSTGSKGEGGGGLVDPVPSAKADPVNGSRLKAKYRTGDDGSKEYLSGIWYDSERQEDCVFETGADGKQRCMPPSQTTPTIFADAACKQPIAVGASECPPKYAVMAEQQTCGSALLHIYSIGMPMTPAKVYVSVGGTCFDAGPPDPGATYYQVGAEVPASSFVASAVQRQM